MMPWRQFRDRMWMQVNAEFKPPLFRLSQNCACGNIGRYVSIVIQRLGQTGIHRQSSPRTFGPRVDKAVSRFGYEALRIGPSVNHPSGLGEQGTS
jgi:hypothetical protein